ncbi:MAG: hypothetical protein AB8B54_10850 [Sphingorhabdus sp.]
MINRASIFAAIVALPISSANAQSSEFDGFVACGAYYLALEKTKPDWAPDAQAMSDRYALLEKAAIAAGSHTTEEATKSEMTSGGDFLAIMANHKTEARRTQFKGVWRKCSNMHVTAAEYLAE